MYDKQALPINSILKGKNYQYYIEKVIGQGSFGITYLANLKLSGTMGHLQTNVKVAVKEFFMRELNGRSGTTVLAGSNSELYHNYRNDFVREAEILSKLKHPNIVKVLEFFEENNTAYFSMEYIEGCNLNDYIQSNGSLSECEALGYLSQILEALSCMHNNKMLHLDLKPLNIMRRTNGEIVLIDFGLSKQFDLDGKPELSTHIGRGTIGYAPLEQMNYKKEDGFSPTLDIYALGGILYKMLTGITPPDASIIFNDGFPEASMQKMGFGQEIISLILWSMEPMRRKRPQTTGELLTEIKRILPYACVNKKDTSCDYPQIINEPIMGEDEICNDFHIYWNEEVSELQKSQIRDLLKAMRKIGVEDRFVNTEYGRERISCRIKMSLGEETWHYLYPIIIGDATHGYFPPYSIRFALQAIQQIAYWTGLPFRLSNEEEIIYERTAPVPKWENHKTLCYSKNKKLQYKTYGAHGELKDLNSFHEWNIDTYDIQLVCDGLKPLHDNFGFDVPCTQEFVDEILPIGFNLYKTRKGDLWNIKSPDSPMSSYLEMDYEVISNIGLWHFPGGGPTSGYDYLGIVTHCSGKTYYYRFENGDFDLLEMLSDEDIEERQKWT